MDGQMAAVHGRQAVKGDGISSLENAAVPMHLRHCGHHRVPLPCCLCSTVQRPSPTATSLQQQP
jgi:hypothetical protein